MNAKQFSFALGKVDDKYIMESAVYERKKKTGWRKWGLMAACFCLLLTAAAMLPGVLKGTGSVLPPSGPVAAGPVTSDKDRQPGTDAAQLPKVIIEWDKVAVNEVNQMGTNAAPLFYDPALYDEEAWGETEIKDYYGWLLVPGYIPKGLTGEGGALSGTVIRSKESGELVRDQMGRGFWSGYYEDGSPKSGDDVPIPTGFTVAASKLGLLRCGLLPPEETKTTNFGSVPVTIIHCAMPYGSNGLDQTPAGYYDAYQATFELNGVKYEVFAQRLELEEVIQIAASVIGGQSGESLTVGGAQEP